MEVNNLSTFVIHLDYLDLFRAKYGLAPTSWMFINQSSFPTKQVWFAMIHWPLKLFFNLWKKKLVFYIRKDKKYQHHE